uniref:Uncharacterized protein n=1 Tax=Anguilla anguilla TaxID=7936 RepID=A0A0E9T4R1_ANGAN
MCVSSNLISPFFPSRNARLIIFILISVTIVKGLSSEACDVKPLWFFTLESIC